MPKTGRYKLEVWGAQGGYEKTSMDYNQKGDYGGYSKGEVYLKKNYKLYIVVGEQGKTGIGDGASRVTVIGGYNGAASVGDASGYIGNTLLKNKAMYCYNCTASSDAATENCSKQGNGYAKVTYMGE